MLELLEPVRGLRAKRGSGASEVELAFLGSCCELRLKVINIVRLFGLTHSILGIIFTNFDNLRHKYFVSEWLSGTDGKLLGQVAIAISW